MKFKSNRFFGATAILTLLAVPAVSAATWTGDAAPNASWATVGNWSDSLAPNGTITYDATSDAALTQNLDGSYSVTGISLTSPTGAVVVNNGTGTGNTLTIGSGGVDLSSAAQNLTLSANLSIGANQSWTVAGGLTLRGIAGSTTSSGSGTGNVIMSRSTVAGFNTGIATVIFNQNGNIGGGQTGWTNYSGNITINPDVKVQSQGNAAARRRKSFDTGMGWLGAAGEGR